MVEIILNNNFINNNPKVNIIGYINEKEYFFEDITSKAVFYYYKNIIKELVNTSFSSFKECLKKYNLTVGRINFELRNKNIKTVLKLYQHFINDINNIDFEGAKSFFWQEKFYDVDILIEDEIESLKSSEDIFFDTYIKLQIDLNINNISTYKDYLSINTKQIVEKIKNEFIELSLEKINSINKKITEIIITTLYGQKGYQEYLSKMLKKKQMLMMQKDR